MTKPKTIKIDPGNFRAHPERNKGLIAKSLEELGAGRSILIDNEDCTIAGNGVYAESQKLGIPVRVIESNGKELIVVKRTDLKYSDQKRKELALADNATGDTSEWDEVSLGLAFTVAELEAHGVDVKPLLTTEEMEAFFNLEEPERNGNKNITLDYTASDYEKVVNGLKDYGRTPSRAVYTLLGLRPISE